MTLRTTKISKRPETPDETLARVAGINEAIDVLECRRNRIIEELFDTVVNDEEE